MRLLRRHIHNVVDDIRREMPLREATHFIALGGDVRFAAERMLGRGTPATACPCSRASRSWRSATRSRPSTSSSWSRSTGCRQADAETLVPALLAYRELLLETGGRERHACPTPRCAPGCCWTSRGAETRPGHRGLQPAGAGQRGRAGREVPLGRAARAPRGARWPLRLFDQLQAEHGLGQRERRAAGGGGAAARRGQLREPARAPQAHLVHPVRVRDLRPRPGRHGRGGQRGALPPARAARRSRTCPTWRWTARRAWWSTSCRPCCALANALDADHLQKVKDVRWCPRTASWVLEVEGAGDLTMERLAVAGARRLPDRGVRTRGWPSARSRTRS